MPDLSRRQKTSRQNKVSRRPRGGRRLERTEESAEQFMYHFDSGTCVGSPTKAFLGGKGANLHNMVRMGLPVPPGFTIPTHLCKRFYAEGRKLWVGFVQQMMDAVYHLQGVTGKKFGDSENPLLVSVRSGARDSMPGMMDTILNLGLNDETVEALTRATGNGRFAWDCYRRFIQMYGDVVMGVQKKHADDHEPFEEVLHGLKEELGVTEDTGLDEDDLRELVVRFKQLIKDWTGKEFPSDPIEQLKGAIGAVFGSWMNERATTYRAKYKIPEEWGTAVNVQAMVFGNMGDDSGTGVAFTRNPATGENVFYGEYLVNAQGEDVVAGVRTPEPIFAMAKNQKLAGAYRQLLKVRDRLERRFGDVQDFEFTIERGKLYMLQTRNGKRTAFAHMRFVYDMVRAGLMKPGHAVTSFDADTMMQLLQPIFDVKAYEAARKSGKVLTKGLAAGPGAATGRIVFNAQKAEELAAANMKKGNGAGLILCRVETSPEDLRGMIAADGILTARGGVSSHAALVARQMGKVCVVGAGDVQIDYRAGTLLCNGKVFKEGDEISINGTTGEVLAGAIATAPSELKQVLVTKTLSSKKSIVFKYVSFFLRLVEKYRTLGVRTNADTPEQVRNAVAFGAEGIGLCRTEHMFFEGDRIDAVREMILAHGEDGRRHAVAKLLPYQRDDFVGIFEALEGRPACIRLLDPPLHEFLPQDDKAISLLARKMKMPVSAIKRRIHALHEFNPMLGHRGCRLGISYPEITEMQARAIFEAAAEVQQRRGKRRVRVNIEIMIPLITSKAELDLQKALIDMVAAEVSAATGQKFVYMVGTMIELPRACVKADDIAQTAQFFSFGTNDLTQTTLGMSRDDSGSFLPRYQELGIYKSNPFESLDTDGVGRLVSLACDLGRAARPNIKLGICGEHGGDPTSIKFFATTGLAYVSCSPFRVLVARIAAAQAAIEAKHKKAVRSRRAA